MKSNLTYEQAQELCLNSRWKVGLCHEGEKCWCRTILPESEIYDQNGEEIYIVGSGEMPKIYAEHIVKIHNATLLEHSI